MTTTRDQKLAHAEAIIHHHFTNQNLLWEALQISGSGESRIGGRDTSKGNQNLAILGNLVMAVVVADDWIESGQDKGRLNLSCIRASVYGVCD